MQITLNTFGFVSSGSLPMKTSFARMPQVEVSKAFLRNPQRQDATPLHEVNFGFVYSEGDQPATPAVSTLTPAQLKKFRLQAMAVALRRLVAGIGL